MPTGFVSASGAHAELMRLGVQSKSLAQQLFDAYDPDPPEHAAKSISKPEGAEEYSSRMLELFDSLLSRSMEYDEDSGPAEDFLRRVADARNSGISAEEVLENLLYEIEQLLDAEAGIEESTNQNDIDIVKKLFVKKGKKTMLFRALDTFWMFVRTYKVAPGLTTTTTRRPPHTTRPRTTTSRPTTTRTTTRRTTTIRTTTTSTSTTRTTTTRTSTTSTTTTRTLTTSSTGTETSGTATTTSTASIDNTIFSTLRPLSTPAMIPGGTAEISVFLDVAARVLLNDICASDHSACTEQLEDSFHQAVHEESRESDFSRSRLAIGLMTPRRRGVVVVIYILEDDDLRFSSVLQKVLEDVPRCRSVDSSLAICRTPIGATFSRRRITPTVTSIRMIP
ncbi:hypothetical protein BESB_024050 [Besnoitia besnoiti]|uniref:Uncharacterized protein n=1 Tax=Besnoitia besnoiti TaxID=94643 RepID=A0A2A9M8A5_BESBE|nr:hypothetical protein BESB_024050 [Besnoitia besnoiti]PFH31913.1 hypothetical protein BESB_024050 [Besnoitia besnoiti]